MSSTVFCNITGTTTKVLGLNFQCTVEATTGAVYIWPSSDDAEAPTTDRAFKISEGGVLDVKVHKRLNIGGDSTTAKFQAIVWSDDNGKL